MATLRQATLTFHGVQIFHVGGGRSTGAGRGGQGGQQVGGVRATVARQQGHLMVVLGCGQATVGRCGGNREAEPGEQQETPGGHAPSSSFTSDDNQLSTTISNSVTWKQLRGEHHLAQRLTEITEITEITARLH